MTRIKYDASLMGYISIFENMTRTKLKDCFLSEELVIFVVQPNEIAKAIGKNGQNAKMVERILKKKIKIVEFSDDVIQFIKNFVFPLKVQEAIVDGNGLVTLSGGDTSTKSMLIGRNASNLRNTEGIVKRYFPIEKIRVV